MLLVENHREHAELIQSAFAAHAARFRLTVVDGLEAARRAMDAAPPDLVITAIELHDGRGLELLGVSGEPVPLAVVAITSDGDECEAVEAIKAGALDYVVKDERSLGELPHVAERALREWHHIVDKRRAEAELLQRERELRQAHKMEAIGGLASGVAHDFNNVLTGIIGCADVALSKLGADHPARTYIDEIRLSARAASSIARRLLGFARERDSDHEVLDLNGALRGLESMLRHLLKAQVELELELGATDAHIVSDAGELDQVILNLVTNARDAMPAGGRLSISTRDVCMSTRQAACLGDLPLGRYVALEVADTGVGMDEATQRRAFDPFFTTKEPGKGTGLGLSSVYAIVRRMSGCIELESEPGAGTRFRIYLPVTEAPLCSEPAGSAASVAGGRTILVVEDEPTVRLAMRHYLEQGGYHVIEAGDAMAAGRCCEAEHVDLVLSDVVIPGGGGRHVRDVVRACCPEQKVMYVSAHPSDVLERDGRIELGARVLQKPFTAERLLDEVSRALSSRAGRSVLLVEDHRAARMAIAELLRDHGFDVLEADTGAAGAALCEDNDIDVVLTDIGLPDIDGIELAARIRALKPNVRILFASGTRPDDERLERMLAGADTAFVEKPIDADVVARMLDELLVARPLTT